MDVNGPMKVTELACTINSKITYLCNFLADFALLGSRIYLAIVFFQSGIVKQQSWQVTVMLFKYEYQVPFISPATAAYLATTTELIFPILILLGFGARIPAIILFVFNLVAVNSYPFLLTDQGLPGYLYHMIWATMLGSLVLFGPGKFSVDKKITLPSSKG